jgi:hypothetical protein
MWADYIKSTSDPVPDATVSLADFSLWALHYNDQYSSGQNLAAHRNASALGEIVVGLEEEWPLLGQRKLHATVRLEGVEPFKVMLIALKNEDSRFDFANWQPNPALTWTTAATQVARVEAKRS